MDRLRVLLMIVFVQATHLVVVLCWLYALFFAPQRGMDMIKGYDLYGNTVLRGKPRQYVSSRAYLGQQAGSKGWSRAVAFIEFFFGKGHCQQSWEDEQKNV